MIEKKLSFLCKSPGLGYEATKKSVPTELGLLVVGDGRESTDLGDWKEKVVSRGDCLAGDPGKGSRADCVYDASRCFDSAKVAGEVDESR